MKRVAAFYFSREPGPDKVEIPGIGFVRAEVVLEVSEDQAVKDEQRDLKEEGLVEQGLSLANPRPEEDVMNSHWVKDATFSAMR